MERIEPELVWNKHSLLDEEVGSAAEENIMDGIYFNEADTIGNESAHYEKFLLDDFDNYVDEINDRLTVSRLVTDSVIKGIVNAVVEETAEKVASKEAEIAFLKEKLQASNHIAAADNSLESSMVVSDHSTLILDSLQIKSLLAMDYLDKRDEWVYPEHLGRMKISVDNQIQRLKEDFECVRNSSSLGSTNGCSTNNLVCQLLPQARKDEKLHSLVERIDDLRLMLVGIFYEISNVFSSMKVSTMEQHWEHELHEEISTILLQNLVRDIQEECETKILEQRKLINALSTNYQLKVSELSSVREDLDAISKSLLNSDQSLLLSHSSSESLEEQNNIRWKDQFHLKALGNNHSSFVSHTGENGASIMPEPPEFGEPMLEIADFPHLKHLSKEDLAAFYKIEMTKMRRQHDKAMEEKTDELFRLKREFLKEKDSFLSKKDKEFEHLKKDVRRIILNLDDILVEKEMPSVVNDDCDEVCSLKTKINSMFFENQRLHGLLMGKSKEVEHLSVQVTDAASQMLLNTSVNQNLLEQIANLKGDFEDLNAEVTVKEELDAIILKEVISKHCLQMEDAEMESNLIHDLYSIFVKESTRNEIFMRNTIALKQPEEKASLESMLSEKELELRSAIEANNNLEQEITSLYALISEKEKVVFEAGSTIKQQKEEVDLVNQELNQLRDQVSKQNLIISGNKIHSDFMRSQFDDALEQLHVYEMEIDNLNQKLAIASSSLEELEREKTILNNIIKEKENKLPYSIIDGNNQEVKQVELMASSWRTLSEVSLDFESKLAETVKRNESRLRALSNQCSSLKQQVNLLLKKGFWYKRMFEIRNSNLQTAEAEVDLLGDEVDALLSVLGKVYVALDHYSPVLQHYPGVMEILKLVQRELQGETATSR
ncbi:hypothetical protein KFK09_014449 [Dendrobium nobile]|uniref:WPP domain-associated protein n=1 Tax=Dendrobium nobile TaxID=94219 RepID=A0A8T3B3D9_DENNO|nr:hypothetical protein KFK09_014449 [Dendrobium nobile]